MCVTHGTPYLAIYTVVSSLALLLCRIYLVLCLGSSIREKRREEKRHECRNSEVCVSERYAGLAQGQSRRLHNSRHRKSPGSSSRMDTRMVHRLDRSRVSLEGWRRINYRKRDESMSYPALARTISLLYCIRFENVRLSRVYDMPTASRQTSQISAESTLHEKLHVITKFCRYIF